jgi:hypothetical protein
MSPTKARDLGRSYKGFADHLRELGDTAGANYADRQSAWWLAYALALSQIPPGATGEPS